MYETAILHVIDDITRLIDDKQIAFLLLIDFSRAFDTVNHQMLLEKLKMRFGFSISAIQLMTSYLSNRSSIIYSNNEQSHLISLSKGVPQGSILGPLLYCLYVEDIGSSFEKLNMHCYADDTQLYIGCQKDCIAETTTIINEELQNFSAWAEFNSLKINAQKSHCIIISKSAINVSTLPSISLNGDVIDYVSKVNNLGYVINERLDWSGQINRCSQSIFFGLRCLWNSAAVLPTGTKLKLVQTLLGHHIHSADVIVGQLDSANFMQLNKAFNAMTRFVFNLRRFDHVSHVSSEIFGFTLEKLLLYKRQIFLFNLIRTKEPRYLFDKLEFVQSTRLHLNIKVPRFHYRSTGLSFFINDIIYWNSLPQHIKNSTCLADFKRKLSLVI